MDRWKRGTETLQNMQVVKGAIDVEGGWEANSKSASEACGRVVDDAEAESECRRVLGTYRETLAERGAQATNVREAR